MGAFMVVAAFSAECRNPILIYGAIEKAFLLYLVLTNLNRPYAQGFWAAAIDATAVCSFIC